MSSVKLLNVQVKILLSLLLAGVAPALVVFNYFLKQNSKEVNSLQEFLMYVVEFGRSEYELVLAITGAMVLIALIITKTITFSLRSLFSDIRKYAVQTHETSLMVKDASQNVSAATTEQASAIQETVATLNEINAMVSRSVENAIRSSDLSNNSKKMAQEGHKAVDEMVVAIEEINKSNSSIMKQINQSNLKISEIVEVITEISNKTQVINDIVFQTKLLSFNASVEAARAGEHGKGFSVVAEEVGSLAQMSGNAAKEISDMLSESINKVEGIVNYTKNNVEKLVEDGKSKVESGVIIAKRCGEVLEDVVVNVNDVNNMIGEISEAAKQQAEGVNNISIAMNELDDTTHGNANTAYKTLEFADVLINHSKDLNSCVNKVEEEVFGRNRGDNAEILKRANDYKPKNSKFSSPDELVAQYKRELSRTSSGNTVADIDIGDAVIEADNVINIESYATKSREDLYGSSKKESSTKKEYKKIVVGSDEIPSEDDPRFEDI